MVNFPLSLALTWYKDDLCVSKITPAMGENLTHPQITEILIIACWVF